MPASTKINHSLCNLGLSLEQFLKEEQQQFSDIPEALPKILSAIAWVGKAINDVARKLDLVAIIGSQLTYNSSGDEQQKLDIMAHGYFLHALNKIEEICAMISEEDNGIIQLNNNRGNYIIAVDPLDGSPNIASNAPIGTIFSIYQRISSPKEPVQQEDVLQAGKKQLGAGYILYGTSTMLIYTANHGVHGFTYEPSMEKFFLAHQAMQMPKHGKIYATNDGHFDTFPGYVQRYIQKCRLSSYAARYLGALAADFHQHLIQGGIYLYPPTQNRPQGKLRLMLECNALAFIAEQAGGAASNGTQSILSIQPQAIHQQVPLYIGSMNMIQKLLSTH